MKRVLLLVAAVLLFTVFLTGCSRNATPISKSGIYFDTIITITVYNDDHMFLLDECFSLAEKYENL